LEAKKVALREASSTTAALPRTGPHSATTYEISGSIPIASRPKMSARDVTATLI
jgi:hypothetical protein